MAGDKTVTVNLRFALDRGSLQETKQAAAEVRKMQDNPRGAGGGDTRQQRIREFEDELKERAKLRSAADRQAEVAQREQNRRTVDILRQEDRERGKVSAASERYARMQQVQGRLALSASTAAVGGILQMARAVAMLGLVGEKDTQKLIDGLIKIQFGFELVQGGVRTVVQLSRAWSAVEAAAKAAAAAQAAGGVAGAAGGAGWAMSLLKYGRMAGPYALPAALLAGGAYAGYRMGVSGPESAEEASTLRFKQTQQAQERVVAAQLRIEGIPSAIAAGELSKRDYRDRFNTPSAAEWQKRVDDAHRASAAAEAARAEALRTGMPRTVPIYNQPLEEESSWLHLPGEWAKQRRAQMRGPIRDTRPTSTVDPDYYNRDVQSKTGRELRERTGQYEDAARTADLAARERQQNIDNLQRRIELLGQERGAIQAAYRNVQIGFALSGPEKQQELSGLWRTYQQQGVQGIGPEGVRELMPWVSPKTQEKMGTESIEAFTQPGADVGMAKWMAEVAAAAAEEKAAKEAANKAQAANTQLLADSTDKLRKLSDAMVTLQGAMTDMKVNARIVEIQTNGGSTTVKGTNVTVEKDTGGDTAALARTLQARQLA